jgi:hypothetical protein
MLSGSVSTAAPLDVRPVVAGECFTGVVLDRAFQRSEQVLVVDDVAVFLVLAVEAIDAAYGLEQAVVLHLLVDVEVGRRRRVETGEELVHHDEQLHLPGLVDEALLYLLLELVGLIHGRLF